MHDPVLASIIRLTRERDAATIGASVLEAVVQLTPAHEVSLYQLSDRSPNELERTLRLSCSTDDSEPPVKEWTSELSAVPLDDALRRCIERSEMVRDCAAGSHRSIFPVSSVVAQIGALELRSAAALDDGAMHLVNGLLTVYGNYLAILDEGSRDKLTGLLNRRTFDEKLTRLLELQRVRQQPKPQHGQGGRRRKPGPDCRAWIAILDLDHFKRINDSFGHAYGDEVLLTVAQKLRNNFRKSDLLFRFGGEEFVIVLEPIPAAMAFRALERFRTTLESHRFHEVGTVTGSIGFAGISAADYPPRVLECADRALYYSKANGRNCVHQYEALVESGELSDHLKTGSIDLF